MHLKFPYFTYLHLSRTITRKLLLVKFFPRTRNSYLSRKAIKKNIPRFVEFSSLQTSSMQSNKIGKKKVIRILFEESCERITQQASIIRFDLSSFWKRVRACEACYAPSGLADLEDNFPDCNWEQSEWRSKRSAAKHERRVIQLAKSVDTQERQPAADDNCQR